MAQVAPRDTRVGGERPFRSALVSRLLRGGGSSRADRVLIADAARERRRTGLDAIPITRLTGRRRSEQPSAAEAVAGTLAL